MAREVLIVGAGPVGLALALALALHGSGLGLTLVDARTRGAARSDPRTLALSHGSRLTLQRLGVWDSLPVTPIRSIHVSQHGGFGRTRLEAADHDVPALGYVVAAGALAAALDDAVGAAGITVLDERKVTQVAAGENDALVSLDVPGQPLRAHLVVCAEGGMAADDPEIRGRDYDQHALITMATPAREHQGLAYERFTPQGPLALLPCGRRYAVVHTAAAAEAERLLALGDADYLALLEQQMGGRLRFIEVDARRSFPLALRYRRRPVGERTAWIGNASQTLHPVAGQGFNLALRDVWALARQLLEAAPDADPGAAPALAAYARERKFDRGATIATTDALVRLFSNRRSGLAQLRGAGLLLLDVVPPLRGFLARRMMFGARAWP